jgi:hypothetical protein
VRRTGVTVALAATDAAGQRWLFDVSGAFTTTPAGLFRADNVWRALGRALALRDGGADGHVVLLTTHLPRRGSDGDTALRATTDAVFDVIALRDGDDLARLGRYARGDAKTPDAGFWSAADLRRRG